jgi:hypothetical protein
MLTYADVCSHVCSRMLAYADAFALAEQASSNVCSRMLTYALVCSHVCSRMLSRMLTYADICRLQTYALVCSHVCLRMLTYAYRRRWRKSADAGSNVC